MRNLHICVAGVDPESNAHLRPVTTPDNPLTRRLLAESGGPFEIGAVVELGEVRGHPDPPEIEDHRFQPERARRVGGLDPDEYLQLIDGISHRNLKDAFGRDLRRRGPSKYATDRGKGDRSLACIRARSEPALRIEGTKLRLQFNDPWRPVDVPVTDVRFFEDDQKTLRYSVIDDVSSRLRQGVGAWIMFGLSRAFPPNDANRKHWLQVNGLCLEDRPLGPRP